MSEKVESGPYVFTKVESIEHLKELLKDGEMREFRLLLNFGAYSRKIVRLMKNGKFDVENCIDDSHQRLSAEEIMDKGMTNIGDGIAKGSFWLEEARNAKVSGVR